MPSRLARLLLVAAIVILIITFVVFDLHRFLTLGYLKEQQQAFADFYAANRLLTIAIYFALYVLVTALVFLAALIYRREGIRSENRIESMLSREAQ